MTIISTAEPQPFVKSSSTSNSSSTMAKNPQGGSDAPGNRLVLVLGHGPISHATREALVQQAATTCTDLNKAQNDTATSSLAAAPTTGTSSTNLTNNNNNNYLILTGSSHVPQPGKQLQEWETHWSSGEQTMARLIGLIGLEAFQRPRGGNGNSNYARRCKLSGHLLDMTRRGGARSWTNHQHQNNINTTNTFTPPDESDASSSYADDEENNMEVLKMELLQVAQRVVKYLTLIKAQPVGHAAIILPSEWLPYCNDETETNAVIARTLQNSWKSHAVLENVDIAVQFVQS